MLGVDRRLCIQPLNITVRSKMNNPGPKEGVKSLGVHTWHVAYQNNLWEAIHRKNYNRVVYLTDRWTDTIWYQFCHPRWGEFLDQMFRSCLQTLLYTSVLGKEVVLDNGLKIDLRTLDGSTSFYWAVVNRSNACVPGLHLDQLGVEPALTKIAQHLVLKVLNVRCSVVKSNQFKPTLVDKVPILHVLLSIDHRYERPDQSVDLFQVYISRHPEHVNLVCPWTGMSTLDLLHDKKQKETKSISYMEDQVINCVVRTLGKSPVEEGCQPYEYFRSAGYFTPTHIPDYKEICWEKKQKRIIQLRETLDLWRYDERSFREKMKTSILTFSGDTDTSTHGKVINGVMGWLKSSLEEKNTCNDADYALEMSGSVNENTKIFPLDELDVVLRLWLDVDVEVRQCTPEDFVKIRKELARSIGKQPAQHLVRVILRKDYPHLGKVGDELTPDVFAKAMDCFISTLLKDVQLPSWLRCPEGKSMVTAPDLLERTKAGLVLNLEYNMLYFDETANSKWQELSIDLVSVLVLSKDQRETYLQVINPLVDDKADLSPSSTCQTRIARGSTC